MSVPVLTVSEYILSQDPNEILKTVNFWSLLLHHLSKFKQSNCWLKEREKLQYMIRPTRNMIKKKKKSQSVGLTMESVVTKRRGWTQH